MKKYIVTAKQLHGVWAGAEVVFISTADKQLAEQVFKQASESPYNADVQLTEIDNENKIQSNLSV